MHRALRLIWLIALMLTASALAGSAADVECQIDPGFGGRYTRDAWAPVRITLLNKGKSASGRIAMHAQTNDYGGTVLYTVPIELPTGARKSYRLLLPELASGQRVRIEAGGETIGYQLQGTTPVAPEELLLVVLGSGDGVLGFLNGTPAPVAGRPDARSYQQSSAATANQFVIAQARWGALPVNWLGWDGVDAAFVSDAELGDASAEEVEALALWVRLGGTLVVTGGARAPAIAAGPLGDLLPMEVSGTRTARDLSGLEAWGLQPIRRQAALIAEGVLREDAEVLLGTQAEPLVVRRKLDAGAVVMATFDLTAEPVKYWDGQEALWRRLVGAGLSAGRDEAESLLTQVTPPWMYGSAGSVGLAGAAGSTQEASLPPLWLVTGFLVAYIVALVPVNYWFVNRLKRRELAWLTTPAIILVFFGAAWGTGFALRGHQTLLNRLAIVEVDAGQQVARAIGYAGIFSPAKTDYTLRLAKTASVALTTEYDTSDRLTVEFGPEPRVKDIALNMWSTRVLEVPFVAELGHGLSGYFDWNGSDLSATVRNNTGLALKSVGIVREARIGPTTELAAGQEGTVDMRTATQLTQEYAKDGVLADRGLVALFGEDPQGYGYPTGSTPLHRPVLVAVHDRPLMPVELEDVRAREDDATIIAARLPVRLSPGQSIALPNWLVTSRIVASTGNVRQGPDYYGYSEETVTTIESGSATWEFTLPTGQRKTTPLLLEVYMSNVPGMAPPPPPGVSSQSAPGAATVEASNYLRRRWVPTIPVGTRHKIPSPAECLSPDGHVQVRVTAKGGAFTVQRMELSGSMAAE